MRAVPAALPDLRAGRDRNGVAARAHRVGRRGYVRRGARRVRPTAAPGSLLGLHGLRAGLPGARALRPADRRNAREVAAGETEAACAARSVVAATIAARDVVAGAAELCAILGAAAGVRAAAERIGLACGGRVAAGAAARVEGRF